MGKEQICLLEMLSGNILHEVVEFEYSVNKAARSYGVEQQGGLWSYCLRSDTQQEMKQHLVTGECLEMQR